jgi:hypothetical protein
MLNSAKKVQTWFHAEIYAQWPAFCLLFGGVQAATAVLNLKRKMLILR